MRRYSRTAAFIGALLALMSLAAMGADNREKWIPNTEDIQALDHGEDCSVYRSVARKAKWQRKDLDRRIEEEKAILRARFEALQNCGRTKGVAGEPSSVLAEACPSDYRSWIAPVYRLKMLEQDARQATRDLDSVGDLLGDYCQHRAPRQTIDGEFF